MGANGRADTNKAAPGKEMASDDEPEELSVDSGWRHTVGGWFRKRWHIPRVAMVLLCCLALGLGASGSLAWIHQHRQHQPRIAARVLDPSMSSQDDADYLAGVAIRNTGKTAVTVDKIRLTVPGYKSSGAPEKDKARLKPGHTTNVFHPLTPDCDVAHPNGPATIHVHTRGQGQGGHWTTQTVPQVPFDTTHGKAAHLRHCSGIAGIELKTLHTATSGDVLKLRVRLTFDSSAEALPQQAEKRKDVRVTKLALRLFHKQIRVSFTPSSQHGKHVSLPATGTLRIRTKHCDTTSTSPASLDAAVATSSRDLGTTSVNYDPQAAARILKFTTKHCS